MISSKYKDLSDHDNFIAVNDKTHKEIHKAYNKNRKFDDGIVYGGAKQRFISVLNKMYELNDDIESILFRNVIEYKMIIPDVIHKLNNAILAKQFGIPTNDGMIQWHNYYIKQLGSDVPQDTDEWYKYMKDRNGVANIQRCLELRHLGLYSSYKNFRNNTKAKKEMKDDCKKELERTTELLRKKFDYE